MSCFRYYNFVCYQEANDRTIFFDTVIILGLPIEFTLLKHVVGLIFALLNTFSFSVTAHLLKEQRRDSANPWLHGGVGPHVVEECDSFRHRGNRDGRREIEASVTLRC